MIRGTSIPSTRWLVSIALAVALALEGCALVGRSPAPDPPVPATGATATNPANGTHDRSAYTTRTLRNSNGAADPVVLRVNGISIRLSEYREGLEEFHGSQGSHGFGDESEELYRRRLIDDLLMYDYARQNDLDAEPEFRRELQRLQRRLLVDYVRRTRVLAQITVSPEDVRKYYDSNGLEFTSPRMVQVRAIQTASFRDAQALYDRLKADPGQFADLAREHSIHPSRSLGGEMDPFPPGTYAQAFEEVAFRLKIGEISPVIATEQGYYILEKLGEIPEQRPPLSEVQSLIEETLREKKEREATEKFLGGLRQSGTVEVGWPTAAATATPTATPEGAD